MKVLPTVEAKALRNRRVAVDDSTATRPVVALLPWGLLLEDFLIPNGLTLESFCQDFTGSWMFGYVEALTDAGVDTVIICVCEGVRTVVRTVHRPTGAQICLLPASSLYRRVRGRMRSPYSRTVAGAFSTSPARRLLVPALFGLKELAPYLSTPAVALARELRHYRCNAVLCQEYEFPRFDVSVAIGRLLRVPVFATFQGGDDHRWRTERLTRPLALRLAAGVIVAPQAEVDRLRARYRIDPARIARIPNPVDLETWRPLDRAAAREELGITATARVTAWHGRVELRKKGLDTLVDAWAKLSRGDLGEPVLLLIGTGNDADVLRARVGAHGLTNVVWVDRYLHDRSEIARLLAAADVYALTSRYEGFPVAPIEAMACGLPVVSTDAGGIRDILPSGEDSGGVVVPRDDPLAFARALASLLTDIPRSRQLGRRARQRVEEFSRANVGERLRAFLFAENRGGLP